MVKKKRQNDPQDENSTSESCDDKQTNNSQGSNVAIGGCQHVIKSVDPQKLRKFFKTTGLETKCRECKSLPDRLDDDDCFEYDNTLWLCLKCGTQLCGRSKNQHALTHFQTPRSDSHALALNTKTFQIWCYTCDDEVNPSVRKKLMECVDFVKKLSSVQVNSPEEKNKLTLLVPKQKSDEINLPDDRNNAKLSPDKFVPASLTNDIFTLNNQQIVAPIPSTSGPPPIPGIARRVQTVNSLPRVRGLSNLGNTCFFNAVLQCLAQTPYLLEVLREASEPGEQFVLPGGKCNFKDNSEIRLPPINGQLPGWRALTASLADALSELQTAGDVFTPSKVFQKLTHKCPQFRGGDQHDSHELLRHLLESVRNEDLERYKTVILNSLGYNGEDINTVSDEMKQKCKFYAEQAADRILRPDQVFRGILVSILTCQECYNTSPRRENFLDLSLPVSIEKPQPPIRRKGSPEPAISAGPSKHQLKKEKEKERKAKRAQKHHNKRLAMQPIGTLLSGPTGDGFTNRFSSKDNGNNSNSRTSSSPSDQSDADIEDNLTDDMPKYLDDTLINRSIPPLFDSNGNNEIPSPIDPEKRGDSPENPNKDSNDDENDSGIATSPANTLMLEQGISEEGATFIRQRTHLIDNEVLPSRQLEEMSLKDKESFLAAKHKARTKRSRKQSYTDWSTTIAPRYQCENGECSIQSCLNNFTAVELMTGNNKVSCESCTKSIYGEKGKPMYTNATKQFLISSPPAVLILHLKRFQVGLGFMFRKITKHVSFPMVLDIAPFCSSKIKNPNVDRKQQKLLYALYGIVEHAGGMHGGHYTAYVKVRQKLASDDMRWKFIPQGNKAEIDQVDEQRAKLDELLKRDRELRTKENDSDDYTTSDSSSSDIDINEDVEGAVGGSEESNIEPPPGKWYYVSDSFVSETTEQKVLEAQAYLLFYERIY